MRARPSPESVARAGPEDGSTVPLILAFFVVALLLVAGSVAAGQAFTQQREVQSRCDGAAVAAGSAAASLGRRTTGGAPAGADLSYDQDSAIRAAVESYLDRDPQRRTMQVTPRTADDGSTLQLTCRQSMPLAFGAVFGKDHVVHVVTSSVRSPVHD